MPPAKSSANLGESPNMDLATNPMKTLKVGYRLIGEDDFVPLYPEDLQHFSVI